jgi:outer membrane immunogenic protein
LSPGRKREIDRHSKIFFFKTVAEKTLGNAHSLATLRDEALRCGVAIVKLLTHIVGIITAVWVAQSSAWAADIEVPTQAGSPPPVVYYPPPSAPFANWTGCFAGANGGIGLTRWQFVESAPVPLNPAPKTGTGLAFGGQLGCDYQIGSVVFGFEGVGDAVNIKTNANSFAGVASQVELRESWLATATARIGYTFVPAFLLYAKGGAGWAGGENTGWTAGVGVEWKCLPNASVFVEYDYLGFGAQNVTLVAAPTVSARSTVNTQAVLLGFNYRFNLPWEVTTRY